MPPSPPVNRRPKLPPALTLTQTQLTGSPRHMSQSAANVFNAFAVPASAATYSPFRSAGLAPPTPYGGSLRFSPRKPNAYGKHTLLHLGRVLSSKPLWLVLLLGGLMLWWVNGGRDEMDLVRLGASELGRGFFLEERTQGLQFFPATNPKIHVWRSSHGEVPNIADEKQYVGRWTATPNRLRRDGTFPGVYFDVIVKNTTTLFLSLHNAAAHGSRISENLFVEGSTLIPTPTAVIHVPFRPISSKEKPAPPVSLLARIDQEEYILLPNASALVSICNNYLSIEDEHRIRIVAPMTDDHGQGIIELEGLWLSKGGKLLRVDGSLLSEEYENEDSLSAENEQVGEKHRAGLHGLLGTIENHDSELEKNSGEQDETSSIGQARKRIVEIVTDSPGFSGRRRGSRTGGADSLLAGVMSWEYLLGDIFGADHVGIGVDGMCLTQNCIGGFGQPSGIGDVFFRSGPFGSEYFNHPWMFDAYVPDVIVLNIGGSDDLSFDTHGSEYAQSSEDLVQRFEDAYISLVKGIRTLAYPQRPSMVNSQKSGHHGYISDVAPAFISIFIMRPLRGELEHSTQNVVTKLRADGDKAVFWLDTSGWLEIEDDLDTGDFFLDGTASPSQWRLTEQGNQRVATFLHLHMCRYLAREEEKCAFLPPEVYQGKVFDPEETSFDQNLEYQKEKKLKKIFWGGDIGNDEGAPSMG